MQFGTHLHELWRLRLGIILSAALAVFVAASSVYQISFFPPSAHSRDLQIASASTRVLVDTPRSKILDLRAGTQDLGGLTTRADLLGNVMASPPVRLFIAQRANVPPERITTIAPITANVPRVLTEPGSERRASDLLKSTDQYRLDIEANPSVPVLDIYAQAPTKDEAIRLANSAVEGLQDYLNALGTKQGVAARDSVRLLQLGRARGGVVNDGVGIQIAILAFLVVFSCSSGAVMFMSRVRRGWRAASATDRSDKADRDAAFRAADPAPTS